ncbi:MAG: glycosyltransferase [Nitrospirota bacterium]
MEDIILEGEIQGRLSELNETDIVVGIPSYNNARTIGHVVKAVQAGLAKYFHDKKAVLVNSDGGSTDETMEVVNNSTIEDFQSILISHRKDSLFKITTPYHGIPGKGSAFRTIFQIAHTLNAKACAVVDSDLRSITPEWIELLLSPVIKGGFDYVAPYYLRHKYDGTITNSIVYPFTRALYGKRIRQPIGGDFGFSGNLASFYLTKDVWDTDVARYGIDIWMTTTAIANNFNVCQSFLGAKIHDPKEPSADLSTMLHQVVGPLFELMETYHDVWKDVNGSTTVPIFGFQYVVGLEPVQVNLDAMIEKFRLSIKELSQIWKLFLSDEVVNFLDNAKYFSKDNFFIPDEIWVRIIYDFSIATHLKTLHKEHVLKSLTPLYLGKIASFIIETWDSDATEVEKMIERLCISYEALKPYLIERWK